MIASLLLTGTTAKSQVLISLLFGKALNTPKIEFGLIGGVNQSYVLDIDDSKGLNNWNLGFYFHINLKKNSFLSTGVLVKSSVGATGMPTYQLGDAAFDSLYADGTLTKKINYFYVPILYHHRFNNRWYLEGGFQLGLRSKAYDIFDISELDGDLTYQTDVRDQYARLDVGLMGGVGFKFKPVLKSTAIGVSYYYGLVDVSKTDLVVKNSSVYLYIKVPIGLGGKEPKSME